MTVRTRFAPSPTGELHLGNARVAVLNWLYARHSDGRFVLRIEDTDLERNVPGAESEIRSVLRDLGLDWDEGPDVGGPFAAYRQSERTEVYRTAAERLLEARSAYRCYCPPDELARKREAARARGANPRYDGTCRDLSPERARELEASGTRPSLRVRFEPRTVTVADRVRGTVSFEPEELDDFVIMKSDGTPTYNFAVVVDDSAMEITHVIRGIGHLSNTPRQLLIYEALGAEPPEFVHVPHVLGPDGAPLSKRQGARTVRQYLADGYLPEALINYLSLLSWSSETGQEVFTPDELIEAIDLDRLGASNAMLDPEKLRWLSGEHIRRLEPEELAHRLTSFLGAGELPEGESARVRFAAAVRERIATLAEAREFLRQMRPPDPMTWSPDAREVLGTESAGHVLRAARRSLVHVEDWSGETALEAIRQAGRDAGVRGRDLFMPVRAAFTGELSGPELPDVLAVQGKATALRVLDAAIAITPDAGPG